jgi:hypothetical protein
MQKRLADLDASTSKYQAAAEALDAKKVSDDAEVKTKAAIIAGQKAAQASATAHRVIEESARVIAKAKRDSIVARAEADSLSHAIDAETILLNVGSKLSPTHFPMEQLDQARSLARDALKTSPTPQAGDAVARTYSLPTDVFEVWGRNITGVRFSRDEAYLIQMGSYPDRDPFHLSGAYIWQTVRGKFSRAGGKPETRELELEPRDKKLQRYAPSGNSGPQLSPDGRYLASFFSDNKVRIWKQGSHLAPYSEEPHIFDAVNPLLSFSSDGYLAFFQAGLKLRIWNPDIPDSLIPLDECQGTMIVSNSQFSPNGDSLAVASISGDMRFCDARTGRKIGNPIHIKRINGQQDFTFAFSHDGTRVLNTEEGSVWDAKTGSPTCQLDLKQNGDGISFSKALFSLDLKSRYIFTVTDGLGTKWVTAWSADECKFVSLLEPNAGWYADIQLSVDGHRILIATATSMQVWNADTLEKLSTLNYVCGPADSTISPKGDYVVAWPNCDHSPILSMYTVVPRDSYDQILK